MCGSGPGYAELHCRSNYSFLTAASHPEELVETAAALGYDDPLYFSKRFAAVIGLSPRAYRRSVVERYRWADTTGLFLREKAGAGGDRAAGRLRRDAAAQPRQTAGTLPSAAGSRGSSEGAAACSPGRKPRV